MPVAKRGPLSDFFLRDRLPWFGDRLSVAEALGLATALLLSAAISLGTLYFLIF